MQLAAGVLKWVANVETDRHTRAYIVWSKRQGFMKHQEVSGSVSSPKGATALALSIIFAVGQDGMDAMRKENTFITFDER